MLKLINKEKIFSIFIISFLYYLFLYPQGFNTMLVGSISSDHLIQTQKYIIKFFSDLNYPYIYNLGHGFDLFATSIHSAMHPLYFFINIFLSEKILLKEIFVKIHMFLFIFGMFVYLRKKILNKTVLILLVFVVSNSLIITTNIPHPFLICTYSYFPILLILIDKIVTKPKLKYFFYFSLIIFLMLMIGHFQHQFIFLTFLMVFLTTKIFKKEISFLVFLKIWFFVSIAFILALPQLLPVFDLMLIGERVSTGSMSRFSQSFNGFTIIGYFLPGLNLTFYKHFEEYYQLFTTSPSLVEGSHYIGIFTISLFFFLIKKIGFKIKEDPIIISFIFLILRALGIYFIINFFINYLPMFGQFRAPIRNLYLVDFLIIIFIGLNFTKFFSLDEFKIFFKNFLKYYIILLLLLILIGFLLIDGMIGKIEIQDYLVIFFSLIILILIFFVIKYCKTKNSILIAILIITIGDLGFYKFAIPLHSKIESKTNVTKNIKYYEAFCKDNKTDSIITLFDHAEINNDLPRFAYGNKERKHFILNKDNKNLGINDYLYTYDCNISMGTRLFTMSSNGATKMHNFLYFDNSDTKLNMKDKVYILSLLGYSHFLNFNKNTFQVLDKKIINNYDTSQIDKEIIKKFFNQEIKKNIFFENLDLLFYRKLNETFLKNLLTTFKARVHEIKDVRFVGYGGTRNLIIKDLDDKVVRYEIYDPFIKVFTDKKTLNITHVPTPFITGIILIIPLIIITSLFYLSFKIIIPIIVNFLKKKINTLKKISNYIRNKNFKNLTNFIVFLFILNIIICLLYLYVLGTEQIQISDSLMTTLKFSTLFILYFIISIFFLFKILYLRLLNRKIMIFLIFIIFNILIGTVMIAELIVYSTPEILINKYNLEEGYFDEIKNFFSKYIW